MKETRTQFGSVTVLDPEAVVKLGMVIDNYKMAKASDLWKEAEKKAKEQLSGFDPKLYFFAEQAPYGPDHPGITCLFRYYTAYSNRRKK